MTVALHSDNKAQNVIQLQVLGKCNVAQLFLSVEDVEGQLVDLVGNNIQNDFVVHSFYTALDIKQKGLSIVYLIRILQNQLVVLVIQYFDQWLGGLGGVGIERDLINDCLINGLLTVALLDESCAVGLYEETLEECLLVLTHVLEGDGCEFLLQLGVQEELTVKVLLEFIECLDNGLLFVGVIEFLFQFTLEEGEFLGGEVFFQGDANEISDYFSEELCVTLEGKDDSVESRSHCDEVNIVESDGL